MAASDKQYAPVGGGRLWGHASLKTPTATERLLPRCRSTYLESL